MSDPSAWENLEEESRFVLLEVSLSTAWVDEA